MNVFDTVHEAYLGMLAEVWDNPDSKSAPRNQPVREKFNAMFKVRNPTTEAIVTKCVERNSVILEYSKKEFQLYESMARTAEEFGKASKFWLKLANPDGTVNSGYGYLIWGLESHGNDFEKVSKEVPGWPGVTTLVPIRRTPWAWCVAALRADKDTRQAVLRFSLPEHFWVGNKDMVCTLHGFFSIRNDKLDFTINMRSNDLTFGLVYDLPWFISLMQKMVDELKDQYPNLTVGEYTHIVHNLHIYDRDESKVLKMLGRV